MTAGDFALHKTHSVESWTAPRRAGDGINTPSRRRARPRGATDRHAPGRPYGRPGAVRLLDGPGTDNHHHAPLLLAWRSSERELEKEDGAAALVAGTRTWLICSESDGLGLRPLGRSG